MTLCAARWKRLDRYRSIGEALGCLLFLFFSFIFHFPFHFRPHLSPPSPSGPLLCLIINYLHKYSIVLSWALDILIISHSLFPFDHTVLEKEKHSQFHFLTLPLRLQSTTAVLLMNLAISSGSILLLLRLLLFSCLLSRQTNPPKAKISINNHLALYYWALQWRASRPNERTTLYVIRYRLPDKGRKREKEREREREREKEGKWKIYIRLADVLKLIFPSLHSLADVWVCCLIEAVQRLMIVSRR